MILERKKFLDELLQGNLLKIKVGIHERTWEFYHKQYHKAFYILLQKAKEKCYSTNSQFRPFLFLMRHSLELYLKGQITNLVGLNLIKTHSISDLCVHVPTCNAKFLKSFSCLRCDSEGDCWRYLLDKNGALYFSWSDNIDAFDACDYYCKLLCQGESLDRLKQDRIFRWELTFQPVESSKLGLIATQYDSAIAVILHAIRDKRITVNDVYLPLLFLLRHSLEIKLKMTIVDLREKISDADYQRSCGTHSVKVLYDILEGLIDKAINPISDPKFKGVCEAACRSTVSYTNLIDTLDRNSLSFRFLKDKRGNDSNFVPTPNYVSDLLRAYRESDSFLCFGILYLHEDIIIE